MFEKKQARLRRAGKSRAKMHELGVTRLVVTRTRVTSTLRSLAQIIAS